MDNEFFLNTAGIQPLLHFDQPPMSTWHPLPPPDLHFPTPANAHASSSCFFESSLSSAIVSSPASVSNSAIPSDRFVIGKLGNSGEITPMAGVSSPCVTPVNSFYCSPPAHPGNSIGSDLPTMPGDPGFAARAARFSSFRSRSFNCRTTQSGLQNGSGFSSNSGPTQLKPGRKLQRVLSSPSLKVENRSSALSPGRETEMKVNARSGNYSVDQGQFGNSRENSSGCETGSGPPGNDVGSSVSKKRKSAPNKGKSKQIPSSPTKTTENKNESNPKRIKSGQKEGNNTTNDEKPPEPPKDYIHVRARRGQATDSHSLAERVRREKIGERMKLLQDIVPGCNKVTGKALMLEEIINYVQSLQRQVEFLSMKLASSPPMIDFSTSNPFQNDIYQQNCSMQQMGALAPTTLYGVQIQQNGTLNQSQETQLAPNEGQGFFNGVPEMHSLCEGDLHTIVEMGLSDNTIYTGR